MRKNFWIGLIILILIIGLGLIFFGNETKAPGNNNEALNGDFVPEPNGDTASSTAGENPDTPISNEASWNPYDGEVNLEEDIIEEVIITYTNNGYSPREIIINKGQTVRFVNNSSRNMWPASDNHPTHEIYAEFDPKGPILPGEFYEFTFQNTGSWEYHDHLRASQTGTITVK